MNNKETILNAPGLVGLVAKYINETSYKEQPILAMAAAIVAVGTIYGHRLQTKRGLRTNVYIFAIADSGAGKESSRQSVKVIFVKLPESLSGLICGDPASASGLLSALNRTGGVGLFLIDEIGHYLYGINGKNAPSHTRDIMPLLTKLFTSANTIYHGMEYSDRTKGLESKKDIEQPCVCVLGSSVPERVYNAITLDDICDGFLPRWIIFESDDISPSTNPNIKSFDESSGPELVNIITERINNIDSMLFSPIIQPLVVLTDELAAMALKEFEIKADNMRKNAIEQQSNMKYIYTRAYEYAEKLALIACEYNDNTPVITKQSAQWAIAVVEYSLEQMKKVVSNVAANPYEQEMECMLDIITRRGKMQKSEFCNYCRKWPLKKRESLLSDLVACGQVKIYKDDEISYIEPVKM